MRRPALPVVLILTAALGLVGCGQESDGPEALSLGTGNSTGVYSVLGRGYADLVAEKLPGWQVSPQTTGGSRPNIERIVAGEDDIGFSTLSWASDAITGQGAFTRPQPIRALARLYLNYLQVIVRSDVTRLEDLRGRAISTGSPGSAGELAADRLLGFAGLDVNADLRRSKVSLEESVKGMQEGRLDAIFWSGGLPTKGVKDLLATSGPDVTILDLSAYYQRLSIRHPDVYELVTIAPSWYGLAQPVRTVAEPNILLVGDGMPPETARELTAVLMGNLPKLATVHPEGRNIARAVAASTDPIPLHSGALRWYRDNP